MIQWVSDAGINWDDGILHNLSKQAVLSNSVILIVPEIAEDRIVSLGIFLVPVFNENGPSRNFVGLIAPEKRIWSRDGSAIERFDGRSSDLMNMCRGGVVIFGHSEGTHINSVHTIFCGLTTEREHYSDGSSVVKGGCEVRGNQCKRVRYSGTEVVQLNQRNKGTALLALACNSISLSSTAWMSSSNLIRVFAHADESMGVVGYSDEQTLYPLSNNILHSLSSGASLPSICLYINRKAYSPYGAAVMLASKPYANSRMISVLYPKYQSRNGVVQYKTMKGASNRKMSNNVEQLVPVLSKVQHHHSSTLSVDSHLYERLQELLSQRDRNEEWGLKSSRFLINCFGKENLLGDSFYLPDYLRPEVPLKEYYAATELCPVCNAKLSEFRAAGDTTVTWREWFCPSCGPIHGGTHDQLYAIDLIRRTESISAVVKCSPATNVLMVVRDEIRGKWIASDITEEIHDKITFKFNVGRTIKPHWGYAWLVGIGLHGRFFIRNRIWLENSEVV